MFKKLLSLIFDDLSVLSCTYSNNIFPEPLNKEEEKILLEKMFANDKDARSKLIEHNLRLVAHIVKKYDNKNEFTDDLISIGTIGLIKGIDSYSMSKDIKLATYVSRCIENEILMHYRTNKKNNKTISLNTKIGFDKDGNEITLVDVLKTEDIDYGDEIQKEEDIKLIKKYFKKLTPVEKNILIKRFGLNNTSEVTQKEIAKELGISRSYVSRIEKRAVSKILKSFIKKQEI